MEVSTCVRIMGKWSHAAILGYKILYKDAFPMDIGLLSFTKYYEGVAIGEDKLNYSKAELVHTT